MQAAKNAAGFKNGWQRVAHVVQRYRQNIFWCVFGVLLILTASNHLMERGPRVFDLIAALLGAFAIGASSHPALMWFKRRWESEDV